MKIWVTGCAGFLGTRLAQRLTAAGHQVVGLSRRTCSAADQSVSIDLASDEAPGKLRELGDSTGYPDVVVHAASRQPGQYSLSEYVKSNMLTTSNLIEALNCLPPTQVIYTSTLSVYGMPDRSPVKEIDPVNGKTSYALTKYWAEQIVETLQNKSQVIILRLPSLYGCGQADSFIDGLARQAMDDGTIELFAHGEIVRDTLHVDDVIDAIMQCVANPPEPAFGCFNLGCGARITASEYAQALVEALDSKSAIVLVDRFLPNQFDLYADIEGARLQIGFHPAGLMDSMKRYANELRTQS